MVRYVSTVPPAPEATPIGRGIAEILGDELIGLYLYGSAVTSGLQYDSDLDFLAVVTAGLDRTTRKTLCGRLLRVSGRWPRTGAARPVELTVVARDDLVPWRFPPRADFVYGEWLRADLERGHLPLPAEDPDLTILLAMVRESSLPLYGPPATRILEPVPPGELVRAIAASLPALLAGVDGDERNTVLTLARMWVTAESGAVMSKADAARVLAGRVPGEYAATLRLARAGYLGETADDWTGRAAEVASFARYARERITAACTDPDRGRPAGRPAGEPGPGGA